MTRRLALAASCAAAALGCGGEAPPPRPAELYEVRGELVAMPGPGGREALIRHESVPALRDASGKTVGMASMTMPFVLGADVDRGAFAAGDRIEFTLEVRWDARDPVTATKLRKLPSDTRLEFDADQPAAEPAPPAAETPGPPEGETPK